MSEISSGLFIGFEKIGPFPSTKETPRPRASGIVRISEKIIAASKSYLSIGCKTNSQQTSGVLHISRKFLKFDLTARYSGRYLPACLIIHTGGVFWVFRLSAAIKLRFNSVMDVFYNTFCCFSSFPYCCNYKIRSSDHVTTRKYLWI